MNADKQTCSTHRSGNQPFGTTLPEGKPKSPESQENPLETGISGNNTILQGEEKTALLERGTLTSSANTPLGELPHKNISTATLLGMPHGRAQTNLYWRCPTIGLTGTLEEECCTVGHMKMNNFNQHCTEQPC